jgi:hypothetical protein
MILPVISALPRSKGISRVLMRHAETHAAPLLFQQELTGRTCLSSPPITQHYVECNLFKEFGLSHEVLKPLFGPRGGAHPEPQPPSSDDQTDLAEERELLLFSLYHFSPPSSIGPRDRSENALFLYG